MTKSSRHGVRGVLAALALIVGASAIVVAPAVAAERHDDRRSHDRGHHWHGRPAYGYGAPTYVQAPPPVVYAPPAPGGINLLLNFR